MKALRCAAVRRQLEAFHDGELSVPERVSVASHLQDCASCATAADHLRWIADVMKEESQRRAADGPDLRAMLDAVVGRVQAEREESFPVRFGRLFEDMHFVWAGLSATGATVACAAALFAIWFFSPPERADSLAGMMSALSTPAAETGTSTSGVVRVSVGGDGAVLPAMLATTATEEDLVFALAAVVTQPRQIGRSGMLVANPLAHDVLLLMNAINEARIQNASVDDDPAAVNLVWLRRDPQGRTALALHGWLTHTMVRGKIRS
jgi:anti-sigma factor RsiW